LSDELPIISCIEPPCGACCMTIGVPPLDVGAPGEIDEDDDTEYRELPEHLRREIDDAWDRGTAWFAGKPCIWLDIETRTCRNYEHRPAVCRRFEPGCDTCLEYREENNIPTR
jgi:Fe-S-cluster containining protein